MKKVTVRNMTSNNGNKVANQFIIESGNDVLFQSYNTIIAVKRKGKLILDKDYWNYSRTTSKYRNMFTGLSTQETKSAIKSGEIKLKNLN